jgi:hypothetical protein
LNLVLLTRYFCDPGGGDLDLESILLHLQGK